MPNRCLSGSSGLGDVKLMLFIGCETAVDGNPAAPYDGNLVQEAVGANHVDTAVGFTGTLVTWPFGDDYVAFLGDRLKNGDFISAAVFGAAQDTFNRWGIYAGYNSYWWQGRAYVDKVIPPAYGN